MSYILDALRKAEMERQMSRVPGISSRQQCSNSVRRFSAKLWLLAAVALMAGMTVIWFLTRHSAMPEIEVSAITSEDSVQTKPGAHAEPVHTPVPNLSEKEDDQQWTRTDQDADVKLKRVAAVSPVKADSLMMNNENALPGKAVLTTVVTPMILEANGTDDVGTKAPQASTITHQKSVGVDVMTSIADEVDRDWPAPAPDAQKLSNPVINSHVESAQPANTLSVNDERERVQAEPKDEEAAPVSIDPPKEETLPPILSTLPYRFQSMLPKMVINAQAYSDQPEARFVIINMKKYGEGERTQDGVVVESIGKAYLILSYQGQVFRMQR